ncbi:MAG: hypothetical protein CSB55_07145 [Candidatus Cloacimonadota bacterium]|nr:MAG: hypothetical protein CSB55_07145 [Candidatus Cloacimonadota bacterium]
MKKSILLLLISCLAFGLSAERIVYEANDFNVTAEELKEIRKIPEFNATKFRNPREIPSSIDNSQLKFFPPIIQQSGGSCAQAAGIYYHFGYEMNRLRDTDASATTENEYPSHFTWNFLNRGTGFGSWYGSGWNIVKKIGCPDIETYGGSFDALGDTGWMSGYDKYRTGMNNKIKNTMSIDVSDEEGLLALKQWITDKGEGAESGGLANFAAGMSLDVETLAEGTPQAGKKIFTNWGSVANHAMIFVGFDDEIKYDINGDGQFTNDIDINNDGVVNMQDWEIGAMIIANSWGTDWQNSGYVYMMYRLLAVPYGEGGIWENTVHVINGKSDYFPRLALKVKLSHTRRDKIRIYAGISHDINAEEPEYGYYFPIMLHQGGNHELAGDGYGDEVEAGLDVSDFADMIMPDEEVKIFFRVIEEDDYSNSYTGSIISFSVIDYQNNGLETISEQNNVVLNNNDATTVSVTAQIKGNAPVVLSPANNATDVSVNQILTWENTPGTESVSLYFDTVNPPQNKVLDKVAPQESYIPELDIATKYYWKIVNYMSEEDSTVAGVISFTTGLPENHIMAGDGQSVNIGLPMDPFFGYTYSQSIYPASEINSDGIINKLYYRFNGKDAIENEIDVYMGTTDKEFFTATNDWVSVDQMTMVYSGIYNLPAEDYWYPIVLDTPFNYSNGENLIIAFREKKDGYYSNRDEFYCTETGINSSIRFRSDNTDINPETFDMNEVNGSLAEYIPNIMLEITEAPVLPQAHDLIITEVNSTQQANASYIEVYNNTDKVLSLENVAMEYFNNGSASPTGTLELYGSVNAGEYFILTRNQAAFENKYPGKTADFSYGLLYLNGGNDALKLVCNGNDIDFFNAADDNPSNWSDNHLFERVDYLADGKSLSEDWRDMGKNKNGTPGEKNISDTPETVDNFPAGTTEEFGLNETDELPAVSLTNNGSYAVENLSVEINRGKEAPDGDNNPSVKRWIQIDADNQPDGVTMRFYYKDSEINGLDESRLNIFGYWDGTWHEFPATERNTSENWVEASGIDHFSVWTLKEADNTLPVQLSSFTAVQTSNNFAEIKWTAQTETDIKGYSVYRGVSDNIAESIKLNHEIIPAHNSPFSVNYTYEDKTVNVGETYLFWLESTENNGVVKTFGPLTLTLKEEDVNEADIPKFSYLNNSYPNPFRISEERNGKVVIKFGVKENDEADVMIYNMKGQRVREFNDYKPGNHSIQWDMKNMQGKNVKSGVYFYRLKTNTVEKTRKLLIIK